MKNLYQVFQEMGADHTFRDYNEFLQWARSEGFNGTQTVVRMDAKRAWSPENCQLKEQKAKRGKKAEAEPALEADAEADADVEADDADAGTGNEPTPSSII